MMELKKSDLVGGPDGESFSFVAPEGTQINEVYARADWYLDALQCCYGSINESYDALPYVGGSGGQERVFVLKDDEYLVGISGRCGIYIDTIKLHTNRRESAEIGGNGDGGERDYALMAPEGHEIVGIIGKSSHVINAMGIVTRPR